MTELTGRLPVSTETTSGFRVRHARPDMCSMRPHCTKTLTNVDWTAVWHSSTVEWIALDDWPSGPVNHVVSRTKTHARPIKQLITCTHYTAHARTHTRMPPTRRRSIGSQSILSEFDLTDLNQSGHLMDGWHPMLCWSIV